MKSINRGLTLLFLAVFACQLQAQEIKVAGIRNLTGNARGEYLLSAVSPDGRKILLSESSYMGISMMDIRTGRITVINDMPGAGFEPIFTGDGHFIIFKTDDFGSARKLSSLLSYDLATGETRTLVPKARNLTAPGVTAGRIYCLSEGLLVSSGSGTAALKSSGTGELKSPETDPIQGVAATDTVLLLEDLTPVLYLNGRRKTVKPYGEGSYIWASLSPDKTKIVCYFAGKGTFICDFEGRILFEPGRISAPKWFSNNIIIGMDDRDDGHAVTGSEIVSFSLGSGKTTYLTSTVSRMEMYPFPLPGDNRVVFQTSEGEIFLMKLKIKL